MKKKSFYQLALFLTITATALLILFYFKTDILNFNFAELVKSNKLTDTFPAIQNITDQAKKITPLPEPLRFDNGLPDTVLTIDGVVLWTNQQRRLNGNLEKLSPNQQLNQAASAKLADMFQQQYFDHYSPSGVGPSDFVDQAHYQYLKTGENLALGNFADDQELVQAWMDSPGHRENILTPDFTEIGVAVGKGEFEGKTTWLAVQVFGRPTSDCPTVDQALKAQIDSTQAQINALKAQVDSLSSQLSQSKPKGKDISQAEIDAYNAIVNQYNTVAEQYNAMAEKIQSYIGQYNSQINAFNACANLSS